MRYALLQTSSTKPTVNQLKRAFRALPELTDLDAATKDTQGILMRGLDKRQAEHLQTALKHEDVEVSLVTETDLPSLPLGRAVRAFDFTPTHFQATDPLARRWSVPWTDVLILAAGHILPSPLERTRAGAAELEHEARGKQHEQGLLVADIILRDRESRYTIDAAHFDFSYLGQRRSADSARNMAYVLQDLAQFAPNAGQNRGAYQFCEQPPQMYSYPGRHSYTEELVWMLWLSQNH